MSRDDVLVTADWAEQNLDTDGVVFVEVDEVTSAYDTGHIPGAVKLDWQTDLQDPVVRDFIDRARFEQLLSEKGVATDDTVVLYGGNNNWFAAYAYWYFRLYGHSDVRLLDGGARSGSSTAGCSTRTTCSATRPRTPPRTRTARSARSAARWRTPSA